MILINSIRKLLSLITLFLLFSACKKETSNEDGEEPAFGFIELNWTAMFKDSPFQYGETYTTGSGEQYTPNKFMFYVHSVALQDTRGRWRVVSAKEHYLVDFAKPESLKQSFPILVGQYHHLKFVIGVDSTRNYSGAQTGALDPLNGMFWAWSSGYVFAKLEGHSPDSKGPRQEFTYHVGGYKPPYIAFRTISFGFDSPEQLAIPKATTKKIKLQADVSKWFDNVHAIKIADQYASHSPGAFATKLADNYAGMFKIKNIE